MVKEIRKKMMIKKKEFDDEAHYQGSKKVPLPAKKEYGTGLKYEKPKPKMAKKK